jgi:tetratricopeptide (TPR) repeat protein
VQLNSGLSRRESMLISADSVSTAAEAASDPADRLRLRYRSYSLLEEAARSYPGDPEVWLALGEARFHSSAPIGGQPAAALEAFEHAIALDPGFAPAYEHTLHLATLLNRPDLARKYAEAYLRTDPTDVNAPSIRLAALLLDPSRAHTPETARVIDTASALVLFRAGLEHLGPWVDSGETGIRLARVLIRRSGTGVDPWSDTLMYRQYLAVLLAYRGHLREAYTVDRRLLLNPNASPFSSFGDPFLPLVFFRVIPDSLASVQFGLALRSSNPWSKPDYFTPRQLRALPWWLARRDTAALARFGLRAGQEARRQRDGRNQLRARYLQSSAAAYLTLVRGDSTRALDLFQRISDSLCLENDCFYQKLTQAQLLRAHRQSREAEVLLDRWIWSADGPFYVLAVLERGRIAEGLGEREKAIDSYQFVLDVWRHADPELAPYIREARAGLARMASER